MNTVTYHYRGLVERPRGYSSKRYAAYYWTAGYSADGEHGPEYPWMTRAECRADADSRGVKAVFDTDRGEAL